MPLAALLVTTRGFALRAARRSSSVIACILSNSSFSFSILEGVGGRSEGEGGREGVEGMRGEEGGREREEGGRGRRREGEEGRRWRK